MNASASPFRRGIPGAERVNPAGEPVHRVSAAALPAPRLLATSTVAAGDKHQFGKSTVGVLRHDLRLGGRSRTALAARWWADGSGSVRWRGTRGSSCRREVGATLPEPHERRPRRKPHSCSPMPSILRLSRCRSSRPPEPASPVAGEAPSTGKARPARLQRATSPACFAAPPLQVAFAASLVTPVQAQSTLTLMSNEGMNTSAARYGVTSSQPIAVRPWRQIATRRMVPRLPHSISETQNAPIRFSAPSAYSSCLLKSTIQGQRPICTAIYDLWDNHNRSVYPIPTFALPNHSSSRYQYTGSNYVLVKHGNVITYILASFAWHSFLINYSSTVKTAATGSMSNASTSQQPALRPHWIYSVLCGLRLPPILTQSMRSSLSLPTHHTLMSFFRLGGLLLFLVAPAACTGPSVEERFSAPAALEDRLRNQLSIAEAALAAGQISASRDLYVSLSQRFSSFPEPMLGLGNIAFLSSDSASAKRYFSRASELAADSPAKRAWAEFGLARVLLSEADTKRAGLQFERARRWQQLGQVTDLAPWIENGLAVTATILGDYDRANKYYQQALSVSNDHPAIAANYVRMLHTSRNMSEAERIYNERPPTFWLDDDRNELRKLLEEVSQEGPTRSGWRPTLVVRATKSIENNRHVTSGQPASQSALHIEQLSQPRWTAQQLILVSNTLGDSPRIAGEGPQPAKLVVHLGQSKQIRLRQSATTVMVVSPTIADVRLISPEILYIIGKGVGRTSVTLFDNSKRIKDWIVSVKFDMHPLREAFGTETAFANVNVKQILRSVVLTGEVNSPALAERAFRLAEGALPEDAMITNGLRVVGPQQVNLEVQIAEVQRSVTESLGINWELDGVISTSNVGFRIGQVVRKSIEGALSPALGISGMSGGNSIAALVDALAQAGLATVLARPNLTAASGETASFFSGGEFPTPQAIDDGVIVYAYKKYGVLLDFVPTIVNSNRIILKVRPEVSEASLKDSIPLTLGVRLPIINVRRAETTVEVGDGESIVIAGLFRNSSNRQEEGIPGIGKLPLLDALFGSTNVTAEELELLVTVTARLVGPTPRVSTQDQKAALSFRKRAMEYYF